MGAAAIVFFLSDNFRKVIDQYLQENYEKSIKWVRTRDITCIVLDSCFNDLPSVIRNIISDKAPKLPTFLHKIIIGLLNKGISNKLNISLYNIKP